MIAAMDEGIGKVMQVLEENGMLENTLIVYTSDVCMLQFYEFILIHYRMGPMWLVVEAIFLSKWEKLLILKEEPDKLQSSIIKI